MFKKLLPFTFLIVACSQPNDGDKANLRQTFKEVLNQSVDQYLNFTGDLDSTAFPRNFENGQLITSNSGWWCSGFYPGTLLYLYEYSRKEDLKAEAQRIMQVLEKEQYNTSTHDLGFMMYCSFGKAHELAPSQAYQDILLNSARSLSTRYDPTVKAIRSWDSAPVDYLVIIDNMMNLELLFWATRASGDSTFYQIATTHANTTLSNHFRKDNSSYHVLNYDSGTGEVKEKKTAQGYADESAWARGQSWGLYGYTATYRLTKDPQYLEQATAIADFLIGHPRMPEDYIPYWDLDAPDIPNTQRDASAGAIMASALLELRDYVSEKKAEKYTLVAETILEKLCSDAYLLKPSEKSGFILDHSVGHKPASSEVDVPLTYADYYFIEALMRYLAD